MADVRIALREQLLREQPRTVDRGRLQVVEQELARLIAQDVTGSITEFGCYRGGTTAWMRAILDTQGDEREIHTYDSFQGMPAPADCDGRHLPEGEFASDVAEVYRTHDLHGLRHPVIHAGWFQDTLPGGLPQQIAFIYLDADRYESTLTCLRHAVPRLVPGGILVLDDYADTSVPGHGGAFPAQPRYPGVMKACQEYFGTAAPIDCAAHDSTWGLGVYRVPRPAAVPA
jgi:O-methyltransferase